MTDTYTIASMPPKRERRLERPSSWTEILSEYRRRPGEWRRVRQALTRSFATQLASDLRNVHRRDLSTFPGPRRRADRPVRSPLGPRPDRPEAGDPLHLASVDRGGMRRPGRRRLVVGQLFATTSADIGGFPGPSPLGRSCGVGAPIPCAV